MVLNTGYAPGSVLVPITKNSYLLYNILFTSNLTSKCLILQFYPTIHTTPLKKHLRDKKFTEVVLSYVVV